MKAALENASTPLDCRLEAVLPAVHHRFDANFKVTMDMSKEVTVVKNDVKKGVTGINNKLDDVSTLLHRFVSAAQTFGRSLGGQGTTDEVENGVALSEEPSVPPIARRADHDSLPLQQPGIPMIPLLPVYGNLLQLYQHWYGEREYTRDDGWSIAKLEENHKRRWRNGWSTAQKCQFSRASRIIEAIKQEANRTHKDNDVMAMQWSETMEVIGGKFTLGRMLTWLTEKGFLERKKPRGSSVRK
jgi:hypothetical protein